MVRRIAGLAPVLVVSATVLVVFAGGGPAAAHVTVEPRDAVRGGYARVVFRVPNERADTSVTKVTVAFPADQPVPGVRTMPVPGWKTTVEHRKLDRPLRVHGRDVERVVSRITWRPTSKKDALAPEQFVEFPVSMGPLPETSELVFPASQTYSDGEQVDWADRPADGEPAEHPAPVLRLAKPPAGGDEPTTRAGAPTPRGDDQTEQSGGAPTWLAVAGVVLGLLALSLAGSAFVRSRPEPDDAGHVDDDPDDELDEADHNGDLDPPTRSRRG